MVTIRAEYLALALAGCIFAGCSPENQRQVVAQTQSTYQNASKAFSGAWVSLNDQARQLGTGSSRDDLEQMKAKLKDLQANTEHTSRQARQAAQDQWDRLDLAEKVQALRDEAQTQLIALNQVRQTASKSLDETNKAYAETQGKLAETQRAYDDAAKRAKAAWDALTSGSASSQ